MTFIIGHYKKSYLKKKKNYCLPVFYSKTQTPVTYNNYYLNTSSFFH